MSRGKMRYRSKEIDPQVSCRWQCWPYVWLYWEPEGLDLRDTWLDLKDARAGLLYLCAFFSDI